MAAFGVMGNFVLAVLCATATTLLLCACALPPPHHDGHVDDDAADERVEAVGGPVAAMLM